MSTAYCPHTVHIEVTHADVAQLVEHDLAVRRESYEYKWIEVCNFVPDPLREEASYGGSELVERSDLYYPNPDQVGLSPNPGACYTVNVAGAESGRNGGVTRKPTPWNLCLGNCYMVSLCEELLRRRESD